MRELIKFGREDEQARPRHPNRLKEVGKIRFMDEPPMGQAG